MSKQGTKQARRTHTREFKADTVALVRAGGRRVAQVARDLGLADSLVRSWCDRPTWMPARVPRAR